MVRSPCSDENGLKKGPWSPEEDQKLIQHIKNHGHGGWRALPKNAGLNRCGKSCRLRWTNYLRPDIKRGKFSSDEETTILNLHSIIGNKWSTIATHLPGRTDNEIKNFWNTHLKKKLIRMGFDPMTHRPRSELYTNLPPHLMALANLGEIIGYHHYQQQQQQQNLQQSKACQLASYNHYLECLLQAMEMTSSNSNNANNPTVMEAMNMLPLPSLTGGNGIVDDKMMMWDSHNFDNTDTSFTPSNSISSNQVSVSSALSNVQMSSNFEDVKDTPMNSERIQESSFMGLLHQEESLLKYHLMTPIVTAAAGSIINQEERYINNEGVGLISNSSCGGASSFLPELFYEEEPFIHGIS